MPVCPEDMNLPYTKAMEFLYSFIDYERISSWKYNNETFDPTRSLALLHALGDPHEKGAYIHVAGTNGKGSVVAMIAAALSQSGCRTGMYTSPHLITFRERVRIDGAMITCEDVIDQVETLKTPASEIDNLTFFEVWTALAFNYFVEKSTDVSVLEVGVGGRLDSTNVVTPAVSVITSISYDHVGKLGNTLEEIAAEKAGIIKPGIPVVTAHQEPEAMRVIVYTAERSGAPLTVVGDDVHFESNGNGISYYGTKWNIPYCSNNLPAAFQKENTAVAIAALECAADSGFSLSPENVVSGIDTLRWPGRLQTVSEHPTVVVDGACNAGAITAVTEHVLSIKPRGKIVALVGICADKNIRDVLSILGTASSEIVTTKVKNPRAVDPEKLASLAPDTIQTYVVPQPEKALEKAIMLAGTDGLVLAAGSLYLVGEIMKYYNLHSGNIY